MSWKLTIDARCLGTGIGTYVSNMLAHLRQRENGFTVCAIVRSSDRERMASLCDSMTVSDTDIYTLREQWDIPRAARACDLLHVPHYNAPLLYRGKLVVTIHDLIHIMDDTCRQRPSSWIYAQPMLNLVARKASHLITPSEYSKTQIVQHLGVSPSKITVAHCGVGPRFLPLDKQQARADVKAALGVDQPYILFVGNLKPHKNVAGLLRAFAQLKHAGRIDHILAIVGGNLRCKPQLIALSASLGVASDVAFIPPVREELLPNVYAAADLVVQPSTLEGFGLPVIEAMACGVPVACSRSASLPEVAGEAAEYFDPYNVDDMAAAIERILASPERQQDLRKRGIERAKEFSWEKCAQQHREVYCSLLES
jgi:glycosyltransferase involved in cell wall biosynthesis